MKDWENLNPYFRLRVVVKVLINAIDDGFHCNVNGIMGLLLYLFCLHYLILVIK